jgi:SsrA-binding protein
LQQRGSQAGSRRVVAENRKAYHEYHVLETVEAGLALTGTEIKSIRMGRVNLRDAYAAVEGGEVFLHRMHISPYEQGNRFNHDPYRVRKLLLHRREIAYLLGKTREQGCTLVPLRLYLSPRGKAKLELALVRGKTLYDKRRSLAERDARREMERAFKAR